MEETAYPQSLWGFGGGGLLEERCSPIKMKALILSCHDSEVMMDFLDSNHDDGVEDVAAQQNKMMDWHEIRVSILGCELDICNFKSWQNIFRVSSFVLVKLWVTTFHLKRN